MKNRLRVLREERGWSQAELADRLEVSHQSVDVIEAGKYDPSSALAFKFARLFSAPIELILTDDEGQGGMLRSSRLGIVLGPRLLLLFLLFFFICSGLGYSSLNRVDWRSAPGGLSDLLSYAPMVTGPAMPAVADDFRQFRVLVPYLAKPVYRVAKNRIGTWDPIMFGLLVVDSFFVAFTAILLLMVVCRQVGSYTIALGSALLYLLNFAVPNLRLVGLVDAGEGFFIMLLVWSLSEECYWTLPLWAILGTMAKETFIPFLGVFTLTWWLCSRRRMRSPASAARWIVASWIAAVASLIVLHWKIMGAYQSPVRFGLDLHQNFSYFGNLLGSLTDRNLWYIFFWLLPLSLFRLNRLPPNWRIATAATCMMAFVLSAYVGAGPGGVGRALFSIAGPLLSASVAILLFTGVGVELVSDTSNA